MTMPLQRLDATEFDDLPDWAEKLIDAHNKNVDAIKELAKSDAQKAIRRVLSLRSKTPASATFVPPLRVSVSFVPDMVKVVGVRNLTDVNAPADLTVSVDWVKSSDGFYVRAMPGLADATAYEITLEVTP